MEFFRAVPVLLMMIYLYFAFVLGNGPLSSYWCVVIALTLYNGAVLAEVFRAGVLAVPKGQAEAAYAVGMRKGQVMNLVLMPQADEDHAAVDHQPVRGGAEGHRARATTSRPPASPPSASRSTASSRTRCPRRS